MIDETSIIGLYTNISPNATIGLHCDIGNNVIIENNVLVGDNVTIRSGVHLCEGVKVEDNAFIGPNTTFTNDLFPRSKQKPIRFLETLLRQGASIGANATILAGNEIGKNAMVGAGSVITKNVPPNAIVVGNPARITGYVSANKMVQTDKPITVHLELDKVGKTSLGVGEADLYKLPIVKDLRGNLSYAEYGQYLPFIVKRYFIVFDVKSREVRGEHAHKKLHQFLICVKGSCSVVLDDGKKVKEIELSSPEYGLHVPPMIWGIQYKYSENAVLLALTSDKYKENDYIRDYDRFISLVK